ncbi:MAG: hypothetical protein CMQ17_13375 [Gammaproteobacteria bacterium]|jgi:cbb3-type cytochrome oxidase subunit 1|nr:hypothetical protein [Gammaproteobacteria bacterium]|tara:strand:+ start:365 stop:790 length:426 start_codon:yes stop_codon:yes gene_type:complete
MPKLTIWFIRSAVACLITSLMIGVALALGTVFQLPPIFSTLRPTFFHLFMFGWVTQLIFGVAFWLFPKFSKTQPRGNEVLWWITFWGLNIGLLLRVISEPLYVLNSWIDWGWSLAFSAILQWIAVICFVYNAWQRVKGKGH